MREYCGTRTKPFIALTHTLSTPIQDGNDRLLMRVALAIMGELEPQLTRLNDFELLVTGLKVTPAKWGLAMLRKVGGCSWRFNMVCRGALCTVSPVVKW